MRLGIVVISAFGLFLLDRSQQSEAVVFKFTNFQCESYNRSWFVFHECRLKAISRNKVILNMNGTILYPVNNILAQFKLYKRDNGYKPWLINILIDICKFVKQNYNPFAKMIFSLYKDFSNFNHTCPYVGSQIIQGLYLRPEKLIYPLPNGDYMLTIRWHFDRKPQVETNISFTFAEDLSKTNIKFK
ncbi:uncharacterized protein Dana_GF26787 [Drosophila ananassae]|uniref:MD-2-related lipid-recognition domain-containing protein n=1 Tax=Drosophila ananassae TaxID=7217 RepID=A0A0P9A2I0_DROAN|nr:uncharacterized protein LOC26514196 [Drosophila ananassae]XP_032305703.1 uncharacterized protein LOC116654556 [Drosophila ananassae]KPU80739.1 uncharacterized protein Dana_GF26787 [Drosophila ananassae]